MEVGILKNLPVIQSANTRLMANEVAGKSVRLTHLDGPLPNLALMKLSSWLKYHGANVVLTKEIYRRLDDPDYDIVFGSSIFTKTEKFINTFIANFPNAIVGGTGTNNPVTVEEIIGEDWEDYDYSIYPKFIPSIGFTQRGCRLRCSFCVVPQKEGKVKPVNTIQSIWRGDGHPRQLILLDNDFFGQPEWQARCEEILDGDFEISLNQGINVRLIHKEGAEWLAKLKYRDDQFKSKRIYTAWDNRKDEDIFKRGINLLLDAGIPPSSIMVYMLCGYWKDETMDDIMFRFQTMKEMGLRPYPMVYNNANKELKKFQRWVIRRYYEFVPWEDYGKKSFDDTNEETLFSMN